MTSLIRSSRPFFPREDMDELLQQIRQVLENGHLRNGKNLALFEQMVAQYIGVENAVAFDSDSSAYETALRYFGVKDGEVVVCTNSFISAPNSVEYAGGKTVFADIRAETLSMDPKSLEQNITAKTRGVIVTHISGFPNPDLQQIIKICKKNGLFLVEDATHAFGASVNGRKVGTFGDVAVFAFTPTKVLTTGEGGMLVTSNHELGQFSKRLGFYGSGDEKGNFVNLGRHMVLPEISAILGIYQLRRAEEFIARRNEIAAAYDKAFSETVELQPIRCPEGCRSSYYKYPLKLYSKIDKLEFTRRLFQDYNIETGNIFYPPCHLQSVYQKIGFRAYGCLSVSEQVLARTITLPMHVGLTDGDVDYIIDKVTLLSKQLSKA